MAVSTWPLVLLLLLLLPTLQLLQQCKPRVRRWGVAQRPARGWAPIHATHEWEGTPATGCCCSWWCRASVACWPNIVLLLLLLLALQP